MHLFWAMRLNGPNMIMGGSSYCLVFLSLSRARRARRPARTFVGLLLPQKSNQETGHHVQSASRCFFIGHHARGQALYRHIHHASAGGRPARWCGWWMRTQKGGGPEMNLARNWTRWGRPSGPRVGAVVVWPHHVGMITGQTADGRWIVRSGNDGRRVRERPRSVAGAVFRI